MAGGLAALLDDVAVIAKMTSVAGGRAAAVVVDDAAVTPQYVDGFRPARELPIIWKIARGSLVNKAILITLLMLLDTFLPVVLTPLLMLGGLYLAFEGAEKIYEAVTGHHAEQDKGLIVDSSPEREKAMVRGAITTDFILSAEIMMISLNTINDANNGLSITMKILTLVAVAIGITVLVYGVVALIVKMDDVGLHLTKQGNEGSRKIGNLLVDGMPKVLALLSTVGMVAMLWVGGHILIQGLHTLGWDGPYNLVHAIADPVHSVPAVGGFLFWLVDTLCSAVFGLIVGAIIVAVLHVLPFKRKRTDMEGADYAANQAAATPATKDASTSDLAPETTTEEH